MKEESGGDEGSRIVPFGFLSYMDVVLYFVVEVFKKGIFYWPMRKASVAVGRLRSHRRAPVLIRIQTDESLRRPVQEEAPDRQSIGDNTILDSSSFLFFKFTSSLPTKFLLHKIKGSTSNVRDYASPRDSRQYSNKEEFLKILKFTMTLFESFDVELNS